MTDRKRNQISIKVKDEITNDERFNCFDEWEKRQVGRNLRYQICYIMIEKKCTYEIALGDIYIPDYIKEMKEECRKMNINPELLKQPELIEEEVKKNINKIEKLLWDGESDDWKETQVKIYFKDHRIMVGEITENDVFQPDNGEEFWMIGELFLHADCFELIEDE